MICSHLFGQWKSLRSLGTDSIGFDCMVVFAEALTVDRNLRMLWKRLCSEHACLHSFSLIFRVLSCSRSMGVVRNHLLGNPTAEEEKQKLPRWNKAQLWQVMLLLSDSKTGEVGYDHVLFNVFKGEKLLRE